MRNLWWQCSNDYPAPAEKQDRLSPELNATFQPSEGMQDPTAGAGQYRQDACIAHPCQAHQWQDVPGAAGQLNSLWFTGARLGLLGAHVWPQALWGHGSGESLLLLWKLFQVRNPRRWKAEQRLRDIAQVLHPVNGQAEGRACFPAWHPGSDLALTAAALKQKTSF